MPEASILRDWAIVVHGGAKEISDEDAPHYRGGCEKAVAAGSMVLSRGGTSVEAVVAAIRVLEDNETFNAGTGAVHNSDGDAQLDAAIMDGSTLDVGAVASLLNARNPILAAHALLPRTETLLVGQGAFRFAEQFAPKALADRRTGSTTSSGGDTVGCVAVDREGNIAAGTSTGGLPGAPPGRVGDSPLPGCGFYAENATGGVSLSGTGEHISRTTLAAWALHTLQHEDAACVAESAITRLEKIGGEGGIIIIDRAGRIEWAHNSRDFAIAYAHEGHPIKSLTRSTRHDTTDR